MEWENEENPFLYHFLIAFLQHVSCLIFNRVLLDRAHSDYDNVFRHLDLELLSSPQHSPVNQSANTSETNTSDKSFSKDLSQILVNIKSCRWRHFRPRTPSLHDSDNDELSCRKLYRSITRTGTAQPGTQSCSTSTQSKSSGSAHFGMFIPYDIHCCGNVKFINFLNMWLIIPMAESPFL